MHLLSSLLLRTLSLGALASALLYSTSAVAAEQVVLKYGTFRRSVPVSELTTLAETGEASPSLQTYLALARRSPEEFRGLLTKEVKVNPIMMSRFLSSRIGEATLDQVSQAVHTPSGQANRQALRASLVLSADEDLSVTLLEAIQNYPTREVHVEGERLVQAQRQISVLQNYLQPLIGLRKLF